MEKILVNRIRCNRCGDVITSEHRNALKWCKCGSVAVDGGTDYLRRFTGDTSSSFTELSEYDDSPASESDTGLPADKSYLECGLPDFLRDSIAQMQAAWDRLDRGEKDLRWDCDYCNLQTDINNAEVNGVISSEQAWYLREKYLRMERW